MRTVYASINARVNARRRQTLTPARRGHGALLLAAPGAVGATLVGFTRAAMDRQRQLLLPYYLSGEASWFVPLLPENLRQRCLSMLPKENPPKTA